MSTVIKRDGTICNFDFNKITERIIFLCYLNEKVHINYTMIAQKVMEHMYPGIPTQEIDIAIGDICAHFTTTNSLYGLIGGRILISNLRKNLEVAYDIYTFSDKVLYLAINLPNYLNQDYIHFVEENETILNNMINNERDKSEQ